MDYSFNVTSYEDINKVFSSYFEYYTSLYGNSLLTDVCRKAIMNGNYNSKALSVVDQAYNYTKDTINASNNNELNIIAMKDSSEEARGYFRVRFITINGVQIASVAELVLPDNWIYDRIEELKELISSIENQIITERPEVENLDFEAGVFDVEMQYALVESGFHPLLTDNDGDKITFVYEKPLKELKATR